MKKKAKRLISALLAATVVLGVGVGASGCGKSKKEESGLYVRRDGKKYDSSKTQINVYLYKAGYGEDWIYDYEEAFEKAYANVSLEEGKQGVQVWHAGDMSSSTPRRFRNRNSIFSSSKTGTTIIFSTELSKILPTS